MTARGAQLAASADASDAGLQVGDIHLEGVWVDVDEYGGGAEQQRHLGGRGIGESGEKDGVTPGRSPRPSWR